MKKKGRRASEKRAAGERGGGSGKSDATRVGPNRGSKSQGGRIPEENTKYLKDDQHEVGEVTQEHETPPRQSPVGGALLNYLTNKKILLRQTPFLIGRAPHCRARFGEPLELSKQHLELRYDEQRSRWQAVDLGSKTGTYRNGQRLQGPTFLNHGDFLNFANIKVRFLAEDLVPEQVDSQIRIDETRVQAPESPASEHTRIGEGEAKPPKDKGAKGKKPLFAVAMMVLALAVLAAAGFAFYAFVQGRDMNMSILMKEKSFLLEEAKTQLEAKKIKGAKKTLDAALAIAPEDTETLSYLRIWQEESGAQDALLKAESELASGRPGEAMISLQKIPASSVFEADKKKLLQRARRASAGKSADKLQALIDSGKYDEARRLALATMKKGTARDAILKDLDTRKSQALSKSPLGRAQRAFAAGDLGAAEKIAKRSGLKIYLKDLSTFREAQRDCAKALKSKKTLSASFCGKAYRLLDGLAGSSPSSKVMKDRVGKTYADALYLKAMGLKSKDRCEWAQNILLAERVFSTPKGATQKARAYDIAEDGLEKAKALFADDPKGASAIAEAHQCLAAAKSDVGKKLRRSLK